MNQIAEKINIIDGYVTDTKYVNLYFDSLSPHNISLGALIKNRRAPDINKPFNYFELGCGRGLSSNLNAASYHKSKFYANDIMPEQIQEARQTAKDLGLENVEFLNCSFEDLLNKDLPKMDFIVTHGVWTWVDDKNRNIIMEFIKKNLNKGGIVYVNYNVLAGSSFIAPLQKLMSKYYDRILGSSEEKLSGIKKLVTDISRSGAPYFEGNDRVFKAIDSLNKNDLGYLQHEYMHGNWGIFSIADIEEIFRNIGMEYIGFPDMKDNFLDFRVSANIIPLVKNIKDLVLQELMIETLMTIKFRTDLYGLELPKLNDKEFYDKFMNSYFSLISPLQYCNMKVELSGCVLSLNNEIYLTILNLFAEKSQSPIEIHQQLKSSGIVLSEMDVAIRILHLIAACYVMKCAENEGFDQRKELYKKYNKEFIATNNSEKVYVLLSARTSTPVTINAHSYIFLAAEIIGEDPLEWGFAELKRRNVKLTDKVTNKLISELNEVREEFAKRYDNYKIHDRKTYIELGILDV